MDQLEALCYFERQRIRSRFAALQERISVWQPCPMPKGWTGINTQRIERFHKKGRHHK